MTEQEAIEALRKYAKQNHLKCYESSENRDGDRETSLQRDDGEDKFGVESHSNPLGSHYGTVPAEEIGNDVLQIQWEQGHVIGLSLPEGLSAPPEVMRQFQYLRTLTVRQTDGSLDWLENMGRIARLTVEMWRETFLSRNCGLNALESLTLLYPDGGEACSIPEAVRFMNTLRKIQIDANYRPVTLPDWMEKLPALKLLNLSGRYLDSIPPWLARRHLNGDMPFREQEFDGESNAWECGTIIPGIRLRQGETSLYSMNPQIIDGYYGKEAPGCKLRDCRFFCGGRRNRKKFPDLDVDTGIIQPADSAHAGHEGDAVVCAEERRKRTPSLADGFGRADVHAGRTRAFHDKLRRLRGSVRGPQRRQN